MLEKELIHEISADNIYNYVERLLAFDPEKAWCGSEAERKRAYYVAEKFEEFGLETIVETFVPPVPCFEDIECSLGLVEPEEKTIESMVFAYSPSSPAQGLTAELADVGFGEETDYEGKDVRGKIVIFKEKESKLYHYLEACWASKNGAIGMILINNKAWPFRASLETGYFDMMKTIIPVEPNPIPAVCISSQDGEYILNLLKERPVKVRMKVETMIGEGTSLNVRGMIVGQELPHEKLLLTAHLDTAGTPGARDDTSGIAVLIELARVLSKRKPKRTIEFVGLGGEEICLVGADAYVKMHKDDLENILGVIDIDSPGSPPAVSEGSTAEIEDVDIKLKYSEMLNNRLLEVAKELGYKLYITRSDTGCGEEGIFVAAGVEATWLIQREGIYPYYHSLKDTIENLDLNGIKVVSDIVAVAAWDLVNK